MFVQDHPRHQRNKPANQQTNKSNHANKGTPPPPTNYQLKTKKESPGGGSGLCLPRRGSKTYFLGCSLNNKLLFRQGCVSPRWGHESHWFGWLGQEIPPVQTEVSPAVPWRVRWCVNWSGFEGGGFYSQESLLQVPKGHPCYQFPSWIYSRFLAPKKFFWFLGVFFWGVSGTQVFPIWWPPLTTPPKPSEKNLVPWKV